MPEDIDTRQRLARTDGYVLRDLVRAATRALETNQSTINALNVFPVPDGDTGTNMVLTMRAVRDELEDHVDANPSITSARMSRSALLGARGNSGLILAQFFKGLAESLADGYEVSGRGLAIALRLAAESAYKSVPQPREGTMLTVFRECADAAERAVEETPGLEPVLAAAAAQAMDTVGRTPEMLDVLRDAGVVDSGGYGFAVMLAGALQIIRREGDGAIHLTPPSVNGVEFTDSVHVREGFVAGAEDEAWGYCTVFAIEAEGLDIDAVRARITAIGRSTVIVGDGNIVKVHVHMEDPGAALTIGIDLGSVSNIDIKNMDEQTRQWAEERRASGTVSGERFEAAVVSVCLGDGFNDLFASAGLGALVMVPGGDTMNPSTADLVDAVERAPSECVLLLPNNKNVIGTAKLVAGLTGKTVRVVPTRTMQAGLAALLNFSPERKLDENATAMNDGAAAIRAGAVCRATRDVRLNGVDVKTGQFMGILDDEITGCGEVLLATLAGVIDGQTGEDSLVTLYAGADVTGEQAEEAASAIAKMVHPAEVESVRGGQPNYEFLIAIE